MPKIKGKSKTLGSHVWLIIQGRYEKGDGVRALAKEYGISPSTICNRAKSFGWLAHGQLKEDAIQAAREKIREDFGSSYKEMAKQAVSNHYKLFRYIQQLAVKLLHDVEENSRTPDASKKKQINREIYQLNVLSQTIKSAVDGERLTLGMDSFKWQDEKDGFSKFTEAISQMRSTKELPEPIEIDAVEGIEDELDDIEGEGEKIDGE